jgi:two-component system, OmpR family, phosphate regulon sensor histidine kinase PhoR
VVKRLFRRARAAEAPAAEPLPEPEPEPLPTAPEPPLAVAAPAPDPDHYRALRTSFTAAVSHELRTPLARIMALLDSAALPDADVPALLDQARAEVEQTGELIDEILFLSELETGGEVVALSATQARPVLQEVLDALADRAARAGVELELDCSEELRLPLRPRMLRVVAQNLAENAIRYAGHGSTLRLEAHAADGVAVLSASDDGIGVSQEDLPRLFERFYRSDQARASRGTGLGLAIVKHVVASAGGEVEATGARGEGLRVVCQFPA